MKNEEINPIISRIYKNIYFLGIGGIGMSALARYFKALGVPHVMGYDLTPSPLTEQLLAEGIEVHYNDRGNDATSGLDPQETLVVFTPAVPETLGEFVAFRRNGFRLVKRAFALAEAVSSQQLFAVAGTHGKTTTSTLLAHLFANSLRCNAFLGGVSLNFGSNLLIDTKSRRVVAEADEYDHSFLYLKPYCAIVTATSPDHLDIYETGKSYKEAFCQFISQIEPEGLLFFHEDSFQEDELPRYVNAYSYNCYERGSNSIRLASVYSDNLHFKDRAILFDWHFPSQNLIYRDMEMRTPFRINVLNATAALACAALAGASESTLREALKSFRGVKRRFEVILESPECVLIDDYAHHPEELKASIASIRSLYPNEPILGIFQPHLYSRTKDFYHEFATELSELDEVILLPIYPAREKPIPGVSSNLIFENLSVKKRWLIEKDKVVDFIANYSDRPHVIVTLGAGNIDRIVVPLSKVLQSKLHA